MIDVIKKIHFGDCNDFVEVTVDSIENRAILLGNDRMGPRRTVIYKSDVHDLIEALTNLHDNYI